MLLFRIIAAADYFDGLVSIKNRSQTIGCYNLTHSTLVGSRRGKKTKTFLASRLLADRVLRTTLWTFWVALWILSSIAPTFSSNPVNMPETTGCSRFPRPQYHLPWPRGQIDSWRTHKCCAIVSTVSQFEQSPWKAWDTPLARIQCWGDFKIQFHSLFYVFSRVTVSSRRRY